MKPVAHEGDVVGVPLRDGGWAIGVIARVSMKSGIAVGYFFGPRQNEPPPRGDFNLEPGGRLTVVKFGVLGIEKGEWPKLGRVRNWDRDQWPMPPFQRPSPYKPNTAITVVYDDHDPSGPVREYEAEIDPNAYPDRLAGYGAVEIRLTHALADAVGK